MRSVKHCRVALPNYLAYEKSLNVFIVIIFQNQWIETLINGIVSRRKCTSRYWVFKCYIRLNLYLRTTWTLKKMIYPKILLKNTILSNSSLSLNRVLWEMPLPSKSPLTLMKFTFVIYLMSQKYLLSLFVYLSNSAETPKKRTRFFLNSVGWII